MPQGFLARVNGATKQLIALAISTGSGDAGKIIALGADGRLDNSLMPVGIGTSTISAVASEAVGAGKFVNYHAVGGALNVRLADNSNGRHADGYVKDSVTASGVATVYPLDGVNSSLTGLVVGSRYYLGTAGGVIAAPLVETDVANINKVSQCLGVAQSTTELVTDDLGVVIL